MNKVTDTIDRHENLQGQEYCTLTLHFENCLTTFTLPCMVQTPEDSMLVTMVTAIIIFLTATPQPRMVISSSAIRHLSLGSVGWRNVCLMNLIQGVSINSNPFWYLNCLLSMFYPYHFLGVVLSEYRFAVAYKWAVDLDLEEILGFIFFSVLLTFFSLKYSTVQ